jgi:zinc protease
MPLSAAPQSFSLENGLRVVFVERHGFPKVFAHLVIDTASAMTGDVGSRNAYLLEGTFLWPFEHVRLTSAGCGVDGCFIASHGLSGQLGEVLSRIANLATRAAADPGAYQQRYETYLRMADRAEGPMERNTRALLFGPSHRYGEPPTGAPPALDVIRQLRDRSFVPSAATLVIVGDVTVDSVRAALGDTFASWAAAEGPRPAHSKPPPAPDGPRIVVYRNRSIEQVWGSVVARGPTATHPDLPACMVLIRLLDHIADSGLFHGEREELAAAYTVGGRIDVYKDASVMRLVASFDRVSPIDGMRRMLDAIDSAREHEPPVDDLERAKAALIAEIRHTMTTDAGIASAYAGAALLGLGPTAPQDRARRIAAVSAADVRAAARRYLAAQALRVILDGNPESTKGADALGLGEPVFTNEYGQPVAPAKALVPTTRPAG